MNKGVVSITTRIAVTKQLKHANRTADLGEKSGTLDQFCSSTAVSRVTPRRFLTGPAHGVKNVTKIDRRSYHPTKQSTASKCVLA